MLGGIAFSVYEWLKCALVRHSFLIVEGSIDKMRNIYPLNSRFTLPFAFVLAASLLAVSLMFMLPGGLLHAQTDDIEYPENGTGAVVTFTAIDPEGASIRWSLAGVDAAAFSIENGVLRFTTPPDFEDPQGGGINGNSNTYEVIVQASDDGATTTAMEPVTITVTNVEEPGTVMLSTLQPQVNVELTATLTDPDNETAATVTWQWYRGNSPIAGATDADVTDAVATSAYTPIAGDVGSVLRAVAMYDDAEDEDKTAQGDSAHAVREAPESNIPPTFPNQDPGGDTPTTNQTREVAENTPAGTNIGAPVVAGDTDVLTYSLDDTGAMSFDINRATGHLITKVPLNHEGADSYITMVKATDPFGAEVVAQVTIEVTDVDEDPMFTDGATSIDHTENGTVLDVDADDDSANAAVYTASDADQISDSDEILTWSLSGADASKFDITPAAPRTLSFKMTEVPNYESPGDSGGNNVYEVTVVVTDTKGNTDERAVMVKITNVEEFGAIEFSTLQPRVGFPVTATLTDPDNVNVESLEWQWYRQATNISITTINFTDFDPTSLPAECDNTNIANCSIKGATSAIYVPVDADDGMSLTAVATYTDGNGDGKDYASTTTGINNDVLPNTINDAPVFPDQDLEMEGRQTAQERLIGEHVPEAFGNGNTLETMLVRNVGEPVTATTDDDGALTYSLGGPDAASFSIMPATGLLMTKAVLDKETKDTYTVTVTATDSFGASSTITVTINVENVDEMPDLVGEAPEEYAENGTGAVATFTATDPEGKSITWTRTGADAAFFSIENGVLRFTSRPDYEAEADQDNDNTYEVTIQASDGGANTTATKEVTIEITNVEEPGTITLDTLQPQVDEDIMATLTDPDMIEGADQGTVTWQWYRGSNPISGATNGENTLTSIYMPAAGDVGSRLRATAMYDDAEGDDKTARQDSHRTVRSAPDANTPPTFPDQNPITQNVVETAQEREVAENTPAGTNLGAPIAANDPGDVLTYSIETTGDAASFSINRVTGQLQTKEALDYEDSQNRVFAVTVTATDPFGSPITSVVTITVTDVNEDPILTGGAASIDRAENGTELDDLTTNTEMEDEFTVTDEDTVDTAADLKWSLSGADASKFDISTSGGATRTLSLKEAPDYEAPGDSGRDNVYEVTVVVTDTKGNSDEQDVTVKVTNAEEDGAITLSTLQPRVDISVTATLADPDNITAGSVSWQWYKGTVTQDGLDTLDMNECVAANTNNCFIKGATSATYTPVAGDASDVGDTLVAVALYTDGRANAVADPKDFAMMVTANQVLADTRNKAPVFPEQDDEMEGDQTDQMRMVDENVPATEGVRTVGAFVTATDSITANDGTIANEILTYSLGGPDAASFTIGRGDGQISTKADVPLDTETKDTYTVTVTATDPSDLTATITVTITVTNVDEAPEIMVGGLAISGRSNVDYAENRTDAVATYMVAGPDAASARWSLDGPDAGDFTISSSGVLTFRSSPDYDMPADADNNNTYMVIVKATDGTYTDSRDVSVTVVADADEVPTTISAGPSDTDYAENDTRVVATYMVTGTNAALVTWDLEGTDSDVFDISSNGGVLTFRSPPDYEMSADADTDNIYMIIVKATDGTYTDSRDVTVTVTDVDEALTSISGPSNTDYAENGTDDVATFIAMDPDGATVSWTLEGTDADVFDISSGGGVLTFKSSPDYEMPADANTDNDYMVTVNASDGTDMDSLPVTVTVTDVDEALTSISGPSNTDYAENGTDDVATFAAMDPDGTAISWTLEGTDAGVFDISNGGVLTFKSSPDYEMPADADNNNTYMVTVEASAGADMDSLPVTVTVTDVSDAPLEISGMSNVDYAENGAGPVETYTLSGANAASAIWTLEGPDAGDFTISGGVLVFRSSPDYETKTTYMVTVKATAGADMDTQDVVITVTDVVEMAPEMSLLDRYDTDGNDQIDVDELREAITHYILGDIDLDDVREIIRLYILG